MSPPPHGMTACAEGRDQAAGEIPLFTKETRNSALGTFSCWQGWRGATLLPPPEHSGENPTLVNRLAADPKARLQGSSGSSCASPHARASFQAAAKGAASPRAATMQQLTGPGVKGNVRASARNIKISDKGAIVARELLNFRWIHEPLSLTNQPGARQHPWRGRGRERDKPRDCAGNDPEPAFHGWRPGNDLLCLARSRAPVQCSTALGAAG